jgi:hypothetical protein
MEAPGPQIHSQLPARIKVSRKRMILNILDVDLRLGCSTHRSQSQHARQ